MQKTKPWQLFLIIAVILLTIYNILPTIFYYAKPLKSAVSEGKAYKIAKDIELRINDLENESLNWVKSYTKHLGTSTEKIEINKDTPNQIVVTFKSLEDANTFKRFFPRAGALIPFVPSQMSILNASDTLSKDIVIQRQIPIHFDSSNVKDYFSYVKKFDEKGEPTAEYRKIIFDRLASLGVAIGGVSDTSLKLAIIKENPASETAMQLAYSIAQDLLEYTQTFGENSNFTKRYFSSFTQGTKNSRQDSINSLNESLSKIKESIKIEKASIAKAENELTKNEKLSLLVSKEANVLKADSILKKHEKVFLNGQNAWEYSTLINTLENKYLENPGEKIFTLAVGQNNPLIKELVLDWENEKLSLKIHDDLDSKLNSSKELDQVIINEIARITNLCDEKIGRSSKEFIISLKTLSTSQSLLVMELKKVAESQVKVLKELLKKSWTPAHEELKSENFPVYDYSEYLSLPEHEKSLCFVVYSPMLYSNTAPQGLRQNSIYVMAKGLNRIIQKYQNSSNSIVSEIFMNDFNNLREILRQNGFIGYPGANLPITSEFTSDFIFEKDDYYSMIINASREDFNVVGSKKYATLDFSDLEQRMIASNNIETKIHEDLIKWKDEYNTSQVNINQNMKFDVPPPAKNLLLSNFMLSAKKYIRGDERKIIHWGLDLSGGKTVQLELRDQNNKKVKNEADLKQGVNELYNRVNKMGVSDVNIRIVDDNIILDFPGAQNMSASELIKASSMYFHVVNEKFSTANPTLAENVNRFLQEIWNEAVVTNRKDIESINTIALKHLYGDGLNPENAQPRSDAAKILYENGLRFASFDIGSTSEFDDGLSKIAIYRGKEYSKWEGQTNPLLIVFNNYALDGSSLANIRSSYDPSKGNFLSFEIKGSQTINGKKVNSRDALHNWTSKYSKEKIAGTFLGEITKGRGWRMAVILNDSVISSPNLESALRDNASITGSFTQREINQLVADLKAGALTFTPHILSEKNVSPELGHQERTLGIIATIAALLIVIVTMVGYYKFSGVVASVAVIFNLLFMWATLQNIQATLSLAGIAGVILTVAMAVDANVLVFERVKEEFAISGKIASSIEAGYKRAFNAIFDSNITTIIAALILLNFDSGPIKGFAITLIIGIASSMFSALFMTKFFFARWVQNPNHTYLRMSNLIKSAKIPFLQHAKYIYLTSILIILVGFVCLGKAGKSAMGMDFTGGYSLNINLQENSDKENYRSIAEKAFEAAGAGTQDFQVRELNSPGSLRILFGTSMELEGKPFHSMAVSVDRKDIKYNFETNPRLSWVVSALEAKGLKATDQSLLSLDKSWTAMSGQMSESMRNNAIFGLALALLAIFGYIAWRFEYKYAISAVLCLLHDVFITIASIAILNLMNVPVQLDLHTVAAIMTIVGYSLNDTIIIFDRIREDVKFMRKLSYVDMVNHALNATLSRTMITSGLTLIVLLSLVLLGGSTLFAFSLIMTIGVFFGTLSSLYIGSPLLVFFHNLEEKKQARKLIVD